MRLAVGKTLIHPSLRPPILRSAIVKSPLSYAMRTKQCSKIKAAVIQQNYASTGDTIIFLITEGKLVSIFRLDRRGHKPSSSCNWHSTIRSGQCLSLQKAGGKTAYPLKSPEASRSDTTSSRKPRMPKSLVEPFLLGGCCSNLLVLCCGSAEWCFCCTPYLLQGVDWTKHMLLRCCPYLKIKPHTVL